MKKVLIALAAISTLAFSESYTTTDALTGKSSELFNTTSYDKTTRTGINPGTGQTIQYQTYQKKTTLSDSVAEATGISNDKSISAKYKETAPRTLKDGTRVKTAKQYSSVRYDGVYTEEQKAAIKSKLTEGNTADDKNAVTFKEKTTKKGVKYTTVKMTNYKRVKIAADR